MAQPVPTLYIDRAPPPIKNDVIPEGPLFWFCKTTSVAFNLVVGAFNGLSLELLLEAAPFLRSFEILFIEGQGSDAATAL
jgi:hypothetical protein